MKFTIQLHYIDLEFTTDLLNLVLQNLASIYALQTFASEAYECVMRNIIMSTESRK